MAGKFVISKRSNGEFQFVLKAGNGEPILSSEGYKAKDSCANGVESVRTNSQNDARYERKTSTNDRPYFVLKAGNGEIVGTSELYSSNGALEKGVASVRLNAPTASLDDHTG
jgi:uncharacterized protein YegP (UPF0339 family)